MAHWSPSLLLGYIIFWSIISLCVAFPTGAPASACENMMPVHTGVQPQASPAPYEIQVDASSFVNRQPINVQVVGPGYRGLLLEARTFGSTAALGTWQNPANNTKLLQCSGNPKGAITHSNTKFKTSLTTYTWLPPTSGCPAVITFMAAVAQSREIYWLGVKSKVIWRDSKATCGAEKFTWTVVIVTMMSFHVI
ncbi:putative defense protein 3 [Chelonoidis abingdonii]|uniref:putative defense protein 3 n=1 Tax=Chelonoidis abingdonii TaxID=106734 RepID=UPI0013F2A3FD|nr:putative defense protein 3 isoform X1 [Chelonoidis abingdonii]